MQGDGLQEEATVAGVLPHAIAHLTYTRRNNIQTGGRPQAGYAGHSGQEGFFFFFLPIISHLTDKTVLVFYCP